MRDLLEFLNAKIKSLKTLETHIATQFPKPHQNQASIDPELRSFAWFSEVFCLELGRIRSGLFYKHAFPKDT